MSHNPNSPDSQHSPVPPAPVVASVAPPPSAARRFLFGVKLMEIRLRFVLALVLTGLVVGFWDHITNYYDRWTRGETTAGAADNPFEWTCSMHPFVISDHSGKCPICSMELIKQAKGTGAKVAAGARVRVQATPERIIEAGVKVTPVEYRALSRAIKSYGGVETDETRQSRIIARFPGRVDELIVNAVGMEVKQGDPLARIYSPKYLAASLEYIQALTSEQTTAADPNATAEAKKLAHDIAVNARRPLELAGFTAEQMDTLARTRHADDHVTLTSSLAGTVMQNNVRQGDMVEEGTVLYTIADLSTVWVQAQIIESDLSGVRAGMPVEVTSVAWPGETFYGTVDLIYPTLNAENRAAQARLVINNADHKLRPGMYVTTIINSALGRSGPVVASPEMEAMHLNTPPVGVQGAGGAGFAGGVQTVCPVSGAKLGSMGAPVEVESGGRKILLCCPNCVDKFKADPATCFAKVDAAMKAAPVPVPTVTEVKRIEQTICPVSGNDLHSMGEPIEVTHNGRTIKLCCKTCLPKFQADPEKFIRIVDAATTKSEDAAGDTQWLEGYACPMHPNELKVDPGKCEECPCGLDRLLWRIERVLAVPEEAVIDTGGRYVVYLEIAPGTFEPRDVKLGPRARTAQGAMYYPALEGIKAGDRIVSRGAFLIDAEARLRPSFAVDAAPLTPSAPAAPAEPATPPAPAPMTMPMPAGHAH